MKKLLFPVLNKYAALLFILNVAIATAWAQDSTSTSKSTTTTTTTTETWYAQPWVWIVGGAVFLLLLVALLRGNSNKD